MVQKGILRLADYRLVNLATGNNVLPSLAENGHRFVAEIRHFLRQDRCGVHFYT
jgi:hypothetical protein